MRARWIRHFSFLLMITILTNAPALAHDSGPPNPRMSPIVLTATILFVLAAFCFLIGVIMVHSSKLRRDAREDAENPHNSRPLRLALIGLLGLVVVAAFALKSAQKTPFSDERLLFGNIDHAQLRLEKRLAATPESERLPLLFKFAHDSHSGLRGAALAALSIEAKDPRNVKQISQAMEEAFSDWDSSVREMALLSIVSVNRDHAAPLLLTALGDEDCDLRETAIAQLGFLIGKKGSNVDKRVVPFLIRALDDYSPVVRRSAMFMLRKLTGNPWFCSIRASQKEHREVMGRWKNWWKEAGPHWEPVLAVDSFPPRRPTRADKAPDFRFSDLDGNAITRDHQNGRVTLLNFWGTWCIPCRQELPTFVELDQSLGPKGLDVFGLATTEPNGGSGLRGWCRSHGVTYRQAVCPGQILEDFGYIEGVPVTILIDRRGRIRYRWDGPRDLPTFRAAAVRLLEEPM